MNEKQISKIRVQTRDWYTIGRDLLPEFGTESFYRFAAQSAALVYSFSALRSNVDRTVTISVSKDTPSAYIDLATDSIVLSASFFVAETYEKIAGAEDRIEDLAIAVINGAVVHETLHAVYTTTKTGIEDTLYANEPFLGSTREMFAKYGKNIVCAAFNVMEDLYIEARTPEKLRQWIEATDDFFFSEAEAERQLAEYEEDAVNGLNLAILYKNVHLRDYPILSTLPKDAAAAIELVLELAAEKTNIIQQRVELTYDFLNAFEVDESEGGEGESGDEDSESESGTGSGKAVSGKPGSGEGSLPGSVAEALEKALDEMSDEELERLDEIIREESERIAEEEKDIKEYGDIYKVSWKKVLEVDVLNNDYAAPWSNIDPTTTVNYGFLKELKAIRTLNRTPGAARTSGSVMPKQRLTRIATDGKIFAKADSSRQQLARIEVIINVDLSGSTSGSVANNELGSAMEISKVLREAGIAHSVYGHTSKNRRTPYLIHIFSFQMKQNNSDWDRRFEAARRIRLEENFDGPVQEVLATKFTERKAERYIINLSDGTPCAPDYSGSVANEHTREVVEKIRKSGTKVFSISVVRGVVPMNDRIYGREYNINASMNVAGQFRKLIQRIVGGR